MIRTIIILVILIISIDGFTLKNYITKITFELKSSIKDSFIKIARYNDPLAKDKELIEGLLDRICESDPKTKTSLNDLGFWQICYAPHILILQRVLFTSFKVYYNFLDSNQLESNVFYSSNIFGQGWLNTKGFFIIEKGVCSITWNEVWWDFNTQEEGPSGSDEKDKHVLCNVIQNIGTRAFIKDFSQFPIKYWDNDLVSFLFPLTSTRIVASRLNRPWC